MQHIRWVMILGLFPGHLEGGQRDLQTSPYCPHHLWLYGTHKQMQVLGGVCKMVAVLSVMHVVYIGLVILAALVIPRCHIKLYHLPVGRQGFGTFELERGIANFTTDGNCGRV